MAKKDKGVEDIELNHRPDLTLEGRENRIIAAAMDLAEKQILAGTASSQVITHYLKLGSTKERVEKEILELQKELIAAKTESLKSQQQIEAVYKDAIKAMTRYQGRQEDTEDDSNEESDLW